MDATIQALGGILLRALPTLFLVIFLHFYLKRIFFQPMGRILQQRHAATEGARQAAEASLVNAEGRADQYEAALRDARSELYREQEAQREQLRQQQEAAVAQARADAAKVVEQAKAELAQETEQARATLQTESERLADQIASRVLAGKAA